MEKTKRSRCASISAELAAMAFLCGTAMAQQNLETHFRTTGDAVLAAFEPQREVLQKSSAVIYNGRKEIAYGTVVSADGYILTKASEVEGVTDIGVRVDRELFSDVKTLITDDRWDVALLKVEAADLVPVTYAPEVDPSHGTWVVVNGVTSRIKRRILAGIISAQPREISPEGGPALGVTLGDSEEMLEVIGVSEGSGAADAGVKKGDVITKVNGKPVKVIGDLAEVLKELKAGDVAKVSLKRDGKEMEVDVKLSAKGELFANQSRNDQMSGDFSKRRSGFPRVIQHDILAASTTMGGPVIDLQGRAVGMNIARANRAETFAIPVKELKGLAEGMIAQARK